MAGRAGASRGRLSRPRAVARLPARRLKALDHPVQIESELPIGDDVELYVNDVLQDAQPQAVNGQYEFVNTPLTQGINVVRIVTYGPRGQRREETRVINASGGLP